MRTRLVATDLELQLAVREQERTVAQDTLVLSVFPKPESPPALQGRVALCDPAGKSRAWLNRLGVTSTPVGPGDDLGEYRLLIVGREALAPGAVLPYTPADIAGGRRVYDPAINTTQ